MYELPDDLFTYKAGAVKEKGKDTYAVYVETESHFEKLGYNPPVNERYKIFVDSVEKKHVQYVANELVKEIMQKDFDRIGNMYKGKRYINFSLYHMYPEYKI